MQTRQAMKLESSSFCLPNSWDFNPVLPGLTLSWLLTSNCLTITEAQPSFCDLPLHRKWLLMVVPPPKAVHSPGYRGAPAFPKKICLLLRPPKPSRLPFPNISPAPSLKLVGSITHHFHWFTLFQVDYKGLGWQVLAIASLQKFFPSSPWLSPFSDICYESALLIMLCSWQTSPIKCQIQIWFLIFFNTTFQPTTANQMEMALSLKSAT